MTTPAASEAAAEAAEASAEAAEAAAEAAEAEAVAEAADESGEGDGGDDTTVVVVDGDGGGAEEAQDDATNLDHEQRITRLEERFGQLESDIVSRPSYDEVRGMIPDYSTVVETAESAGAAAAEAVVEAVEEAEETGEPASVRIDEPASDDPVAEGGIVTVTPEVPEAAETGRRRPALFRW